MSLVDKLLELDQAIYHQCEKVAQKAYETAGLGKYDLVRLTTGAGDIFCAGSGIYLGIAGYVTDDPLQAGAGITFLGGGLWLYKLDMANIATRERREIKQIEQTQASQAPQNDPVRPFQFVLGAGLVGAGIYTHLHGIDPIPDFSGSLHNYSTAIELAGYTAAGAYFMGAFAKYFQDTPMQPPKAHKKIWKALADILKEKITTKGTVPVKVPVEHSAVLEE